MIIHSSYQNNLITVLTDKHSIAELSCNFISIQGIDGKLFYFHRIKALPKYEGIGEGRELMIEVCRHIDKENATIYSQLNPYGKRNLPRLIKFFEASDFIMFQRPNVMIRKPRDISKEQPYVIEKEVVETKTYNVNYGDDRICQCDHPYYRHFDSYDEMRACGCKYCDCYIFIEKIGKDADENTNEHTL